MQSLCQHTIRRSQTTIRITRICTPPHLYHEVLDAPVEDGVVVVPHLTQAYEVFTRARDQVAVKFNVEVTQARVQTQVACETHSNGTMSAQHTALPRHMTNALPGLLK
jgi:hypothetical protein